MRLATVIIIGPHEELFSLFNARFGAKLFDSRATSLYFKRSILCSLRCARRNSFGGAIVHPRNPSSQFCKTTCFVSVLTAFRSRGDNDTRRYMSNTNCTFGLVYVLSTRPTRPKGID